VNLVLNSKLIPTTDYLQLLVSYHTLSKIALYCTAVSIFIFEFFYRWTYVFIKQNWSPWQNIRNGIKVYRNIEIKTVLSKLKKIIRSFNWRRGLIICTQFPDQGCHRVSILIQQKRWNSRIAKLLLETEYLQSKVLTA